MSTHLSTLCGGKETAKAEFWKCISHIEDEKIYKLLMDAWHCGFVAHNDVIMRGIADKKISVMVYDSDGFPLGDFIPDIK